MSRHPGSSTDKPNKGLLHILRPTRKTKTISYLLCNTYEYENHRLLELGTIVIHKKEKTNKIKQTTNQFVRKIKLNKLMSCAASQICPWAPISASQVCHEVLINCRILSGGSRRPFPPVNGGMVSWPGDLLTIGLRSRERRIHLQVEGQVCRALSAFSSCALGASCA